jgi:hypothetical protein
VNRRFLRSLHEQHIEELGVLYERRLGMLYDAEIEVEDLAALEERMEAHLDALVVGAGPAVELCTEKAVGDDASERFGAIAVLCRQGHHELVEAALPSFEPEDEDEDEAVDEEEDAELAALPGFEELALIERSPTAEPEEPESEEAESEEAESEEVPAEADADAEIEATVGATLVEATLAGALTDALRSEVVPAWQPVLERWLAEPSPTVLTAVAVTAACRGLSLGPALVAAAERLAGQVPLGPLLWALGRLRDQAALPLLSHHARQLDREEAPIATLALLRFGEPATLEHVVRLTPTHPWACSLLAIAGGPMHASVFQGRLARALVTADEIQAAALFGDAALVPRLLECLAKGLHPEATAQALYLLTGAPLVETVVEPAAEPELLPNGEPDPRDRIRTVQLVQDPTPWREWWSGHQAAFQPGRRYRLGQPASPVVLGHALHRFVLRRPLRQLTAEEIGLRYRPRLDLDVDMRVRSQLAALAELAALRQSDAVVSRTDGMWVLGRQLLR